MLKANLLISLLFAAFVVPLSMFSQMESLVQLESQMAQCMSTIGESKDDNERQLASDSLRLLLIEALNSEGSFSYPFDSLTHMGVLNSPDGYFRIFNWNVPRQDRSFAYYCFVMTYDKKSEISDWTELVEAKREINKVENKYLDAESWLGALYYEIIPIKGGKKPAYTLLGWDGKDKLTTRKIVDVISFEKNGIRLGAPIFKTEMGTNKRYLLEFADDARVSLKWHARQKRIVFDHLAPLDPMMAGIPAYYIPDGTFDTLNLVRGKWVFQEGVEARLSRNESKKEWNDPAPKR